MLFENVFVRFFWGYNVYSYKSINYPKHIRCVSETSKKNTSEQKSRTLLMFEQTLVCKADRSRQQG